MATVKAVWASKINGVACLESDDEIGYFKDQTDHRPSSCTWIKKNKLNSDSQQTLGGN